MASVSFVKLIIIFIYYIVNLNQVKPLQKSDTYFFLNFNYINFKQILSSQKWTLN